VAEQACHASLARPRRGAGPACVQQGIRASLRRRLSWGGLWPRNPFRRGDRGDGPVVKAARPGTQAPTN
jgi:hypothetical protein